VEKKKIKAIHEDSMCHKNTNHVIQQNNVLLKDVIRENLASASIAYQPVRKNVTYSTVPKTKY